MGPLWLILLLPLVAGKSISKESCLAINGNFYNLVSTMTPYDDVKGKIDDFKDCDVKGLWAFIRHGTRFPKDYAIETFSKMTRLRDEILENHANNRGQLCSDDLANFRAWKFEARKEDSMMLTTSGREELRQIGERMRKAFKGLLKKNQNDVEMKITSKERTRQSADALAVGFFGAAVNPIGFVLDDALLKNEKNCSTWKKSTKSTKLKEEVDKFKNTPEVKDMQRRVSQRLGFQNDLDLETVTNMYDVCSYAYSWYHNAKRSPWCAVFNEEDLKLLEYFEDMSYYYKSAYGNEYVPKLGCDLVRDMTDRLTRNEPLVTLNFGHSSGNRKLLVSLGIGNGTPLTGDGYNTSSKRKWRTSYLTPFSANVMGVLYKCKKGSYGIKDKTRIAIFVNERLVKLPACDRKVMCGVEEFRQAFANLTDPSYCNKDFCQIGSQDSQVITTT